MIALGRDIAFFASRLDREQSTEGLRLGENDTWQAATALRFDMTLITDDTDLEKVLQIRRKDYILRNQG